MEFVHAIPSLVRIVVIFIAILLTMRVKKLGMTGAFIVGVIGLIILFAIPLKQALPMVGNAIIGAKTLALAFLLLTILLLSEAMNLTGQMPRMLTAFRGIVKSSFVNLAVFPMITGMLPMVGGAVLSAPMVQEMGKSSGVKPEQLSYINYWYRHVWEFWWPMYPGFLMAVSLINMPVTWLMGLMFPLAIAIILLGWLPARKFMPESLDPANESKYAAIRRRTAARRFICEAYPFFTIIAVGMVAGSVAARFYPEWLVAREVCLIIALVLGSIWILKRGRVSRREALSLLKNKRLYSMTGVVFAIMVFQGMLVGSNAAEILADELVTLKAPVIIITVALPFIMAGLTGITMAYVGAAFPIVISVVTAMGLSEVLPAYMVLALAGGQCGIILSPTHACLVLSNRYFCTNHGKVYRYLVPPTVLLFIISLIYFIILKGYFG